MWKKIVNFLKWAAANDKKSSKSSKPKKVESVSTIVKRARDKKGQYKGDDKSTPDINEAWEGGKSPKKRGRPLKGKK